MLSRKNILKLTVLILALFTAGQIGAVKINDKLSINGYWGLEFEKMFEEKGKGDPNGSFDMDIFDIVLNLQLTNRIRFAADLTWEHGAATEDGWGNVAMEYAFPEITITEWFKIRGGKMFTPFGNYNEIHTAKPAMLTIKEPLSTNKAHKFGSDIGFAPRWGAGVALLGNMQAGNISMDYILGFTNGHPDEAEYWEDPPYDTDDNKAKAINARFRIYPTYDLKIGVSLYTDWRNKYSFDEEEEEFVAEEDKYLQLTSGLGELVWTLGNFTLESEVAVGRYHTQDEETIDRVGFYVLGAYTFLDRLTPYVRYEHLDPNLDEEDDVGRQFIFGANLQVADPLVLKLDYSRVFADEYNDRFKGGKNKYGEIKAAVAVGF